MRARILAATLCLSLLPLVALRAESADEVLGALVEAINRIEQIGTAEDPLPPERLTEAAGVACSSLGHVTGDPLQAMLTSAFDTLEAHYDRAVAVFETPERYEAFLAEIDAVLAAAGMEAGSREAVRARIDGEPRPRAEGALASYAVNLHAGELSATICRVFRQRDGQGIEQPERDPAQLDAALTGLQGLTLIAAATSSELTDNGIPEERAGAATALGSLLVARGYSRLFR